MSNEKGDVGGGRRLKQRVKSASGRRASETRWLERHLNDPYVAKARAAGWRSRAAYKLIELDDRFHVLRHGQRVFDLGAAPGGWSQVAAQRVGSADGQGKVVAIDLLDMPSLPGVTFAVMDFMDEGAPDALIEMLGGRPDVILSDMAPNTVGHKKTDHLRIMGVVEAVVAFAIATLQPGGSFVTKVFQGGAESAVLTALKQAFSTVKHVKPPASRAESAEMYLVAKGFRGARGDDLSS